MQSTAELLQPSTHVLEGPEPPRPQGPNQLSLPSGPGALLRGGRRERTDEDREWYAGLLREAQHSRLTDKVVFERLAYFASLNPERSGLPIGVARLAREVLCSPRTVQYALRRLEAAGLIECLTRAGQGKLVERLVERLAGEVFVLSSGKPPGSSRIGGCLESKEGRAKF